MLDNGISTHILLLQNISEAVCGTALPPELCRMILIDHRGMRSPSARAWQLGRPRRGHMQTMWALSYGLFERNASHVHTAAMRCVVRDALHNIPEWALRVWRRPLAAPDGDYLDNP